MVLLYRDKKVVGVFVRFRAPLQQYQQNKTGSAAGTNSKFGSQLI
jgi:hypothetical protein